MFYCHHLLQTVQINNWIDTVKFIDSLTYTFLFRSSMSENLETELETIETGYTTVSSTNNYTVEHAIVELETIPDVTSYGVHHKLSLFLSF